MTQQYSWVVRLFGCSVCATGNLNPGFARGGKKEVAIIDYCTGLTRIADESVAAADIAVYQSIQAAMLSNKAESQWATVRPVFISADSNCRCSLRATKVTVITTALLPVLALFPVWKDGHGHGCTGRWVQSGIPSRLLPTKWELYRFVRKSSARC